MFQVGENAMLLSAYLVRSGLVVALSSTGERCIPFCRVLLGEGDCD
jgi:hypothetical protein